MNRISEDVFDIMLLAECDLHRETVISSVGQEAFGKIVADWIPMFEEARTMFPGISEVLSKYDVVRVLARGAEKGSDHWKALIVQAVGAEWFRMTDPAPGPATTPELEDK